MKMGVVLESFQVKSGYRHCRGAANSLDRYHFWPARVTKSGAN